MGIFLGQTTKECTRSPIVNNKASGIRPTVQFSFLVLSRRKRNIPEFRVARLQEKTLQEPLIDGTKDPRPTTKISLGDLNPMLQTMDTQFRR